MGKKLSIKDSMMNNLSKVTNDVAVLKAKDDYKIEYIEIEKISANPNNFYNITNVDELAEDIKLNGLYHNLVVRPIGDGKFQLLSGERRFTALNKLVSEGEERFKVVPCQIKELDDVDAMIALIQSNAQGRELTDAEKLKQVDLLKELYKKKKDRGEEVPNRTRDFIAQSLNMSASAVGRIEAISKNLIPELKEMLESEKLTLSNANEFQALSEESQKAILNLIKAKVNITKEEAIELKKKMQDIEKEKIEAEIFLKKKIAEQEAKLKSEVEKAIEESKNESEGTIERLSKDVDKYKKRSEAAIQDLGALKQKQEDMLKEMEEKLRVEANAEAEAKYKSVIEELEKRKEAEKRLQEELENAKRNQNNLEIESIKINTEVITMLNRVTKEIKDIEGKIKGATKKEFVVQAELLKAYTETEEEIKNFISKMKKLLDLA